MYKDPARQHVDTIERLLLRLSGGEPVATDAEMQILALRYMEGLTLSDAGKVLGVSRDRVREKEEEAFAKIIRRIRSLPEEPRCGIYTAKGRCDHDHPQYIRGGGLQCMDCNSFRSIDQDQWMELPDPPQEGGRDTYTKAEVDKLLSDLRALLDPPVKPYTTKWR